MAPDSTAYRYNWPGIVALILAAGLVLLNIVRIVSVPMTFDECISNCLTHGSYAEIARFNGISANNHLLNTFLSKFFTETFWPSPLWARFDSLLAQLVFLLFGYKLCRLLFKDTVWQLCVFAALNLHPFMFEFWGLSRGYGLAIACSTASVYYVMRYAQAKQMALLYMSLLFAGLAVYSNFTLLDYFCGLLCCIAATHIGGRQQVQPKRIVLKELLAVTIASIALYLLIGHALQILTSYHQLYYGGSKDIVSDTIVSILKADLHISGPTDTPALYTLAAVVLVVAVAGGAYWVIRYLRVKDILSKTGFLLWILLAAPAVVIVAQHVLLGTLYPIDRTVLFFIPLFVLSSCYLLYVACGKHTVWNKLGVFLLTATIIYNFTINANTRVTSIWWLEENNTVVLERIIKETAEATHKTKVCTNVAFFPAFQFYTDTKYGNRLDSIVNINELAVKNDTVFDYYYVSSDEAARLPQVYITDTAFYGGVFKLMRKTRNK